jgi:hypothetical protein
MRSQLTGGRLCKPASHAQTPKWIRVGLSSSVGRRHPARLVQVLRAAQRSPRVADNSSAHLDPRITVRGTRSPSRAPSLRSGRLPASSKGRRILTRRIKAGHHRSRRLRVSPRRRSVGNARPYLGSGHRPRRHRRRQRRGIGRRRVSRRSRPRPVVADLRRAPRAPHVTDLAR